MDQVTAAFLGQGAVSLARQGKRALEQLLEHSRTSTRRGTGERFDYTRKKLCGDQHPANTGIASKNRLEAT